MSQSAQYIAQHSDYIVCNVNYRLLGDNGNTVTMNQIIEDVFGAVLWIKDNIHSYGGDSSKVAITGDSSGGHLAAMILCCGDKLESDGFAGSSFGYCPTYLPAGMTAEEVARRNGLTVQAAILSYGAFDIYTSCLNGLESGGNIFWALAQKNPRGIFGDSINVTANGEWYRAVSPVYNIPQASARSLPPTLCTVGSRDNLVSPASVKDFVSLLKEAGQPAEYWEYAGEPHGFLSSGANPLLGISFEKDAPPALDRMIQFLDSTIRR
jgi:acetyl esterase/lipase